jgi:hypothetical protein
MEKHFRKSVQVGLIGEIGSRKQIHAVLADVDGYSLDPLSAHMNLNGEGDPSSL